MHNCPSSSVPGGNRAIVATTLPWTWCDPNHKCSKFNYGIQIPQPRHKWQLLPTILHCVVNIIERLLLINPCVPLFQFSCYPTMATSGWMSCIIIDPYPLPAALRILYGSVRERTKLIFNMRAILLNRIPTKWQLNIIFTFTYSSGIRWDQETWQRLEKEDIIQKEMGTLGNHGKKMI